MRINLATWSLVIAVGWFFILTAAAIVLSPLHHSELAYWAGPALSTLTLIWLILTAVTVSLYFYRSWRRVPVVPNRGTYIAWLAFETACAFALAGTIAWSGYNSNVCSASRMTMHERQLRYNITILRTILNRYFIDNHKRPQSLQDLVDRGYLKEIPSDPFTGRKDSWILEWSSDPNQPGITNVRCGSRRKNSEGTRYKDW